MYSVERYIKIHNDEDGWFYQVGPDRDGLGCVEILYCEDGKTLESIDSLMVEPELAVHLASAIEEVALKLKNEAKGY